MSSFESLGLIAPLTRALAEEGYTLPTPIQAQTIPLILTGKDVLGCAQTGTGKTAAFALPLMQRLAAEPRIAAESWQASPWDRAAAGRWQKGRQSLRRRRASS